MQTSNRHFFMGIALIAAIAVVATFIAAIPFVSQTLKFSSLIVGILLGMIYANTLLSKTPGEWASGMKFCSKRILRAGIVLYGFRLTFTDVIAAGWPAICVDLVIVAGTILLGILFGRLLRMDRDTALMTSTGSAICGAAAVLGAEGVVRCEPHKTAVAVSTVVIFGTLSMFIYPIVYRTGILPLSDFEWAIYTGGTLHEVAHVAGAGGAMDAAGADVCGTATITKMIRVVMLAPVLLVMSWFLSRQTAKTSDRHTRIVVPWFAFGFLLVIGLNTWLCDLLPADLYAPLFGQKGWIETIDTFLLAMAMTALGADTTIAKFRQAGSKPFVLAALLYVWLIFGGLALVCIVC